MLKSLMMACLGVVIGNVGLDLITARPRFTFGFDILLDGVGLVPVVDKFQEYHKGSVNCWHIQELFYEKLKLHPELGSERYYRSTAPEMQPLKATGEFYNILAEKACHVVAVGARLAAEIILRERKVDKERGKHFF